MKNKTQKQKYSQRNFMFPGITGKINFFLIHNMNKKESSKNQRQKTVWNSKAENKKKNLKQKHKNTKTQKHG